MPLTVDDELLSYMQRTSGAIHFEVREAGDSASALRGLGRARQMIFRIPDPEQPDEPCASFASDVEVGPGAAGFWVDMSAGEGDESIFEEALERVLIALEEAGLGDGCTTWPAGRCAQTTIWRRDPRRRLRDLSDWTGDPPPRESAQAGTTGPAVGARGPGWVRCAPIPTPRFLLSATVGSDGRIYTVGGATQAPVKTVEAYDPASDSWSRVASLGVARRGPGVATAPGGRIYAIGGFGARSQHGATVEAYDVEADRWEQVAPLAHHGAHNEMAAACGSDGRIYVLASCGGRKFYEYIFEAYDPSLDTWARVSPPTLPRVGGFRAVAGNDGRIYVMGEASKDAIHAGAYDPQADSWEQIRSPSHPRRGFGATTGKDGRIYVMGGAHGLDAATGAVEAFDPKTHRWEHSEPLPAPRYFLTATTGPDGVMYAIGGNSGGFHSELLNLIDAYIP